MTNREALQKAYTILSPYANPQRWEFNNNLVHLRYITKHIPKESTILDVGCGIGILDIALKLLGYRITGVDKHVFEPNTSFSIDDIDGLRRIWEQQGLSILPKDILQDTVEGQYGAVISIATIEHQKNPKQFLESMLAVIEPGGLLYVATPNISHLLNRVRFIFGQSPISAHLFGLFSRGEQYEGHWREYTLNELHQMFTQLNAAVISAQNVQSMQPCVKLASLRSWYVGLFRLLSYILPGTRDTNIIIAQKK